MGSRVSQKEAAPCDGLACPKRLFRIPQEKGKEHKLNWFVFTKSASGLRRQLVTSASPAFAAPLMATELPLTAGHLTAVRGLMSSKGQ